MSTCDPHSEGTAAPHELTTLIDRSAGVGFTMMSDFRTGALLRTLASSKPGGAFLEIGTGTGVGAQWLASGMCPQSTLVSVESDARLHAIATGTLGSDRRVSLLNMDAFAFVDEARPGSYDLIFVDGEPGKYVFTEKVLALLKVGGFYVVDDLIPTEAWPEPFRSKPRELLATLRERADGVLLTLDWSTGLGVFVKTAGSGR